MIITLGIFLLRENGAYHLDDLLRTVEASAFLLSTRKAEENGSHTFSCVGEFA